ncbi:MAG TPA: hypothetical protein VFB72_04195 [Verrucomicrobiae bacterium]|nr:hypothetical protein [Verrucomicrobiae bacterium]
MLTFLAIGADFKNKERRSVRETVEAISAEKARFILYSLDPERRQSRNEGEVSTNYFHRFSILGKTEISSGPEKRELLTALARAIRERENPGVAIAAMDCFNPRHGIRTIEDAKTNDFVICFECESLRAYAPDGNSNAAITESQEPVFDRYLKEYHLPKAP